MIVGGQTSARALTIMDYHAPFDQGFMPALRKRSLSPLSPEPAYTKTNMNMGCWPRLRPTLTKQITRRSGPTVFPSGGSPLNFWWGSILVLL